MIESGIGVEGRVGRELEDGDEGEDEPDDEGRESPTRPSFMPLPVSLPAPRPDD